MLIALPTEVIYDRYQRILQIKRSHTLQPGSAEIEGVAAEIYIHNKMCFSVVFDVLQKIIQLSVN